MAEAERSWVGDQQTEHPSPGWPRADRRSWSIPTVMNSASPVRFVEDAERAVPGAGHRSGFLDEVPQESGKTQVGFEEQDRFEEPAELRWILDAPIRHASKLRALRRAMC